jgi:hypothetical protein
MASIERDEVEDFVYDVFMQVRDVIGRRTDAPLNRYDYIRYERDCMNVLIEQLAEMAKPRTEG